MLTGSLNTKRKIFYSKNSVSKLFDIFVNFDRFHVNIQSGPTIQSGDINLHLSIRPNSNVIVRNHFYQNIWGTEERFGGCPIRYNEQFELIILAESTVFKVSSCTCKTIIVRMEIACLTYLEQKILITFV